MSNTRTEDKLNTYPRRRDRWSIRSKSKVNRYLDETGVTRISRKHITDVGKGYWCRWYGVNTAYIDKLIESSLGKIWQPIEQRVVSATRPVHKAQVREYFRKQVCPQTKDIHAVIEHDVNDRNSPLGWRRTVDFNEINGFYYYVDQDSGKLCRIAKAPTETREYFRYDVYYKAEGRTTQILAPTLYGWKLTEAVWYTPPADVYDPNTGNRVIFGYRSYDHRLIYPHAVPELENHRPINESSIDPVTSSMANKLSIRNHPNGKHGGFWIYLYSRSIKTKDANRMIPQFAKFTLKHHYPL
jgi:hypothetical protein